MAEIPEFPDSRAMELAYKPLLDAAFAERSPELSAYTFTNIFAWRGSYGSRLSRIEESIIVRCEVNGCVTCLEPIGGDPIRAIRAAFDRLPQAEFRSIHARVADQFRAEPALAVSYDRDNSDYLYLASDLIDLPGRKFDAKRNFVNRIRSERSYRYEVMTEVTAGECRDFAELWCEEKLCDTIDGLRRERIAVHEMLANFVALGLRGGAIRIDNRIVAFSLGEMLTPDTLVVHVEKAEGGIEGLYQLINNEFCIHEACGLAHVNREQDLGVPGLRKAKESYQPIRLVESYRIRRA